MVLWISLGVAAVLVVAVVVFLIVRARRSRNDGPVSIVLFRREPATVTESDVRGAVRRAIGITASLEVVNFDPTTKGFVMMADGLPPIAVIVSARTYLEPQDTASAAEGCEDPRLREAILGHKAWVSVDAMNLEPVPPEEMRHAIYDRFLARIAAEFVDDHTLVLYAPAEGRFAAATPDLAERLARGPTAEVLGEEQINTPIIGIEEDDKAINAAIQTARKRLPELILAFESRGQASEAIVKAGFPYKGGGQEHLWGKITGIEDGAIVAVIQNEPAHPGVPKKGERVSIRPDDVSDWAYLDEEGEGQGMFVERLLQKRGAR